MNKGLLVILFLVGFFAGLTAGFGWASSVSMRDVAVSLDALTREVKTLKTAPTASATPSAESATAACLKATLGAARYAEVTAGGELTADEQFATLPCYATP